MLLDKKIDGLVLNNMSERSLEQLVPIIGDRVKFLKKLQASSEQNSVFPKKKKTSQVTQDKEVIFESHAVAPIAR